MRFWSGLQNLLSRNMHSDCIIRLNKLYCGIVSDSAARRIA